MKKRTIKLLLFLASLIVSSHNVFAQEITVTLLPGCTWFSYPYAESMDIITALGDFTPVQGDVIKSQYSSATYSNGRWMGSLSRFTPGLGYMYISRRGEPATLVFGTQTTPITVTTTEPTDITAYSATCGGDVALASENYVFVLLKGVCWNTNPNPAINDSFIEAGEGLGSYSVSLTDLNPGTLYYVRAFAVTSEGTFYGEEVSFSTYNNGNIGGHDYIDLGLPSGTLWATCNLGADTPLDYGDYFAWAETQPKASYFWDTYQYCNGSSNTFTKYCTDSNYGYNGFTDDLTTLLPEDDAATVNWGTDWRTPTKEEWEELYTNTTRTLTTQDGVYGLLFTASNGYSIFLPAGGICSYSAYVQPGSEGYYMSSTLDSFMPDAAWLLHYSYYTEISNNYFRIRGFSVRPIRDLSQNNVPSGAVNGKFSINVDGEQVYFSQGNLQYIGSASTPYWKFADNQWDFLGTTTGQNSGSQNVDRDLFGWGTSGWNNGNTYYRPWDTNNSDGSLYGPFGEYNLTGTYANADWGVYNSISNGGNESNQWRTLTSDEWWYVFNTRSTPSGIRYAKAVVNGVDGIILLPDSWNDSYYHLNATNIANVSFSNNQISASVWNSMEQHGAVFLPVANSRDGNVYYPGVAYYWSSSCFDSNNAYGMCFSDTFLNRINDGRDTGQSVRLVHPAQ